MNRIRNKNTNLLLTISFDGRVTISSIEFQNWKLEKLSSSNFLLKNFGNEKYLETNNVGEVFINDFSGSNFQLWYIQDESIYNLASGKCLESNILNNVVCSYSNNSSSQKWVIE